MMRHDRIDPAQGSDIPASPQTIRVRDHMTRPAVTIRWDEPVANAWSLMQTRNIRHLPVLDVSGRPVGMVTEANLREVIAGLGPVDAPSDLIVGTAMAWNVKSVHPDMELTEAIRLMRDRKLSALPVVEGDRVVGVLTEIDIAGVAIGQLIERNARVRAGR
jgi:acetoin utilization protein AcuB